ncbi:hypothetical protein DL767_000184 [Monosporascus sp. MG133]|nr:hypothetical protein DL767_000184 [Monosporascus sp. MG133]
MYLRGGTPSTIAPSYSYNLHRKLELVGGSVVLRRVFSDGDYPANHFGIDHQAIDNLVQSTLHLDCFRMSIFDEPRKLHDFQNRLRENPLNLGPANAAGKLLRLAHVGHSHLNWVALKNMCHEAIAAAIECEELKDAQEHLHRQHAFLGDALLDLEPFAAGLLAHFQSPEADTKFLSFAGVPLGISTYTEGQGILRAAQQHQPPPPLGDLVGLEYIEFVGGLREFLHETAPHVDAEAVDRALGGAQRAVRTRPLQAPLAPGASHLSALEEEEARGIMRDFLEEAAFVRGI